MQEEKQQSKVNKTLMRLQNPIYQLKRNDQGQTQFALRKFMKRQQPKPKIQAIQRSPLLSQLQSLMPIFKKSNQQLKHQLANQPVTIDAKLVECESSSQSSSSDNQYDNRDNQKMIDQKEQEQISQQQIQLNFMRYPMSNNKQVTSKTQNNEQQQNNKNKGRKMIQQI